MSEPTIRDRIAGIQVLLRDSALTPADARDSLNELTGLLGNVQAAVRDADLAYKRALVELLKDGTSVASAKLRSETTPEYERWCIAKDAAELVLEMIRTCRVFLRSLDEEMRLAR